MHKILENGWEIIRGHGVEVGIMQTENLNDPEAWLCWMTGQSLTSTYAYRRSTRALAIQQINVWLEMIGLALQNNQIVEF